MIPSTSNFSFGQVQSDISKTNISSKMTTVADTLVARLGVFGETATNLLNLNQTVDISANKSGTKYSLVMPDTLPTTGEILKVDSINVNDIKLGWGSSSCSQSSLTIIPGTGIYFTASASGVGINMSDTTVTPGIYIFPQITINPQGQITSASSGTGIYTVLGGTGITATNVAGTSTVSLTNTAVTSGTFNNPTLDINAQGQVTSAANTASLYNLSTTGIIYDDFLQGPISALSTNGVLTGGDTLWWQITSGTASSIAISAITSNEFGVVSLSVTNPAASTASISWSKPSMTVTTNTGNVILSFRIKINTAVTGTDFYSWGLSPNAVGTKTQGINLVVDPSSAKFQLYTNATTTLSSTSYVVGTWYGVTISITSLLVSVSINGTLEMSTALTIPTGPLLPYIYIFKDAVSVTTNSFSIDYFQILQSFTSSR